MDTEADVSCISKALAQGLIDQKLVVLQPISLPLIKGVGGMPVKIVGTIDLPLKIAGLQISQSFVVIENITCPLILGLDFLMGHQASLNFATRQFHLYNGLTSVPLLTNTPVGNPAVHVLRTTSIPAFSEVLLPVLVSSSILSAFPRLAWRRLSTPKNGIGEQVPVWCFF